MEEGGGPTTVVPGSNVLTFDPRSAFEMQTDGVATEVSGGYRVQPQSAMVGAHRLVCSAGDVVCFDTSTWHTASPNHATRDREAIIINYSRSSASAAACPR